MRTIAALASIGVIVSSTVVHSQSREQQEQCALQAQNTHQDLVAEYKLKSKRLGRFQPKAVSSNYRSYYNTKLKRCLILIDTTRVLENKSANSVRLRDTSEQRRTYAYYLSVSRENEPHSERSPTTCELTPTFRKTTICKSREEFDSFVAKYMAE